MSINIDRINENTVLARTVCDVCYNILGERPAHPWERPGETLTVGNVCQPCTQKRFPKGINAAPIASFDICYANTECLPNVNLKD